MINRIVLTLAFALGTVAGWADIPKIIGVPESLPSAVPSPVASAPDVKAATTQVPQEKKVVAPQLAAEPVRLNSMDGRVAQPGTKTVFVRKGAAASVIARQPMPATLNVRVGSNVKIRSEAEAKALSVAK